MSGKASAKNSQGLNGTVTTADGTPLRGVFVSATALGADAPPVPEIAILTNTAGHFFWPLRPGRYRLVFTLGGREVARREVVVEASGDRTSVVIQADR